MVSNKVLGIILGGGQGSRHSETAGPALGRIRYECPRCLGSSPTAKSSTVQHGPPYGGDPGLGRPAERLERTTHSHASSAEHRLR